MSHNHRQKIFTRPPSPAVRTGLIAFVVAVLLGAVDPRLAAVPLTMFVILCAMAPFFPEAGFFCPVISRGRTGKPVVALTFDDGPDPNTTPLLLDLLARYHVSATFFVTGRRATRYPHLIRLILSHGHAVGNHTFNHDCLRIFWQPARLAREIDDTQAALSRLGVVPRVFRPPVGIVTPAMGSLLAQRQMTLVTFSRRALDRGNRRIHRLADRILSRIEADDIVLLHDSATGSGERDRLWLGEVQKMLSGLARKRLSVVPLSHLIDRPVMRPLPGAVDGP